jgi:hypothetical protein
MKTLPLAAFLAALSVWMAVPGCAHVPPATNVVKNCASAEIKIIADNIIPDVQHAFECEPLSTADLPACLLTAAENLGKQWGQDALNCAVQAYSAPPTEKAALTSLEMIGKTRAKLWLARDRGPGDGPGTAASGPPHPIKAQSIGIPNGQPWICTPGSFHPWDPATSPWHTLGWCQYQPPQNCVPSPGVSCPKSWRTRPCAAGTGPYWYAGVVEIRDAFNNSGRCARVFGDAGAGYTFDTDLVQSNGWYADELGPTYPPARMLSVRLATHTTFETCDVPMQFGCPQGHGYTYVNGPGGDLWFPDITWVRDYPLVEYAPGQFAMHQITVAAFRIGTN